MRRLGSFVMRAAESTRVPAGGALAVDREKFSETMTRFVAEHPRIELVSEIVERIPEARPCVIATGPLTGDALAADIERRRRSRAACVLRRDRADRERGFDRLGARVFRASR